MYSDKSCTKNNINKARKWIFQTWVRVILIYELTINLKIERRCCKTLIIEFALYRMILCIAQEKVLWKIKIEFLSYFSQMGNFQLSLLVWITKKHILPKCLSVAILNFKIKLLPWRKNNATNGFIGCISVKNDIKQAITSKREMHLVINWLFMICAVGHIGFWA